MKNITYFLSILGVISFFSFSPSIECQFSSSNLGSALLHIDQAINKDDINKVKFYAYKALNTLEKSKKTLNECNCSSANKSFNKSLSILKLAAKSNSLNGINNYLKTSKELIENSINNINAHDTHSNDNPNGSSIDNSSASNTRALHAKIDESLEGYRTSLKKVVETVDCKEANEFAQRIFNKCEKELLNNLLSEGKKYYYLRTKQITLDALNTIGDCNL